MSTHRERRLAKAERLRTWAESNDQKAEAHLERAHAIGDQIPLGQPVLRGHHSQGRHERDLARIHSDTAKGFEHAQKADDQASRADSIERAAEHAIYSDDPDAIERLEERITNLEGKRDRFKAYNASCRKGAPDLSLLDDAQRAEVETWRRVAPYSFKPNGELRGATTNISNDIRRNKQRLEQLKHEAIEGKPKRWIEARFSSDCAGCGKTIERGDFVLYDPDEKTVQCRACAEGGDKE